MVLLAAAAARAQDDDLINADRPGIADGSTTLQRGRAQFEGGIERDDSTADGANDRSLFTPLLLRYGMTDAFELRMETAGYHHQLSAEQNRSGWTPVSIGFKAHLHEEDTKSHMPSLGVIARLFVPSGSGDTRSERATGDMRLAADMTLSERWSVNPNLGFSFDNTNADRFVDAFSLLAAATLQCNFTPHLNAFVDGGMQVPASGHATALVDTGVAWIIGRNMQLDTTIGWGAHGSETPRVFWSAGVSQRF